MDHPMRMPFVQYKDYMIERYGEPLFRVPIDFENGCPNRKQDLSGGCTFCNLQGARAIQTAGKQSIEEQIESATKFAKRRYKAKKFMAYVQAFSATFEPEKQKRYLQLINHAEFAAISIGTRPDCLTPQAYDFLKVFNKRIETWVELGIQTTHNLTLERINRGHDWSCSKDAINQLHQNGIRVAAHVILGLPGETPEQFQQTAKRLASLPIDAIKIHNLHVEKGTQLAKEYDDSPFPTLLECEFAEHVIDFIRHMPPTIPIMRLTTDTPTDQLIAPHWHMAKGQFKDYVIQQMTCREWRQGDLLVKDTTNELAPNSNDGELSNVETEDGSITFWNKTYKEHYHTPVGARQEAEKKYIEPSQLELKLKVDEVVLLDVCFGLGYNSLTAMNVAIAKQYNPLHVTALEMDRRVVGRASQAIPSSSKNTFDWQNTLKELYAQKKSSPSQYASIDIEWGDARYTITHQPSQKFDIVYLDAFSTQRNSELWTVDFFKQLYRCMKEGSLLLTYCSAIPVRAGLLDAGFFIGETEPFGRARSGTIAALRQDLIARPLPENELTLIRETTRGIPYKDPYGVRTNKEILRQRQEEILTFKEMNQ